jgi:hypothetical protein
MTHTYQIDSDSIGKWHDDTSNYLQTLYGDIRKAILSNLSLGRSEQCMHFVGGLDEITIELRVSQKESAIFKSSAYTHALEFFHKKR